MGRRRSPVEGIAARELIAGAVKAVACYHLNRTGEWRMAVTLVQDF